MRNFVWALISLMVLINVSCSNEYGNYDHIGEKVPITIDANIEALNTKASMTKGFHYKDSILVIIKKCKPGEGFSDMFNGCDRTIAVYDGQQWNFKTQFYYPDEDSVTSIRAFYPVDKISVDSYLIGYTTSNMLSSDSTINDLLIAEVDELEKTASSIPLIFKHKLSKIKFNFTYSEDVIDQNIDSITLFGVNSGFKYKAEEGFTTNTYFKDTVSFNCLKLDNYILPQQSLNEITFSISKKNRDIKYRKPIRLEMGKVTLLNIKVSKSDVSVDSDIVPWEEGDIVNDEIKI